MIDEPNLSYVNTLTQSMIENVSKVIVGKPDALELAIIGLLCEGHLLIEDIPGVGKTMLARSLARTLGCSFKRIQFTPDMLPGDIIGVNIYHKAAGKYVFQPGPIMAQIVLIDEVNRAAPKAQAALLEAMEERQVTVDSVSYRLPSPFIVLATENRIGGRGTFPLPNSQLDRFFLRIQLGYPQPQDEVMVIKNQQFHHPIKDLGQRVTTGDLFKAQEEIKKIYVSPAVERYITGIVDQTRHHPDIFLGGSPRASMALYRAGQARAAIRGRSFTLPDDVKALIYPALGHRILLSPRAHLRKRSVEQILEEILENLPVSGEAGTDQPARRKSPLRLLKRLPEGNPR
ncbi:MAG: AAA family ATPase [Chloroflexi bacterium RBG_16_48_8]|nr:MAG: AAA family ATPase [Chloroflexi bacterium RBG_16_48_8]